MKVHIVGGGPGGLYTALLIKKEWPGHQVVVHERNGSETTFGFGVVFSDETLGVFRDADQPSYESIRRNFAYWDDVEVHVKGRVLSCGGNGFAGCSRGSLLGLLRDRCSELGVDLRMGQLVDDKELGRLQEEADLVVAADGLNSGIREQFVDAFQPTISLGSSVFAWMGSTRELDAFSYFFKETPDGLVLAHCYQYEPGRSTWVIEMTAQTQQALGFHDMAEHEYAKRLEEIFAEELDGHPLLTNHSIWRQFPTISTARWSTDRTVLIGDAKATAHYSIGSGTKLAMEDSIALLEALRAHASDGASGVPAALDRYEADRRDGVERTQHAASVSFWWFEHMDRFLHHSPEQFAFGLMSRSKQLTYDNLQVRDPAFMVAVEEDFRATTRAAGHHIADDAPPMFATYRLRDMELANRVVVSPMAQYSAQDGVPDDWHFVHLASRAIGGAGLVFVEMTCPSPDARITPGCTGLWNTTQRDAFARTVSFVHERTPTKLCLQLGHSGRKGSTRLGWEGNDQPLADGNWPVVSASPLPYHPGLSQTPHELDSAAMETIIEDFARSTRYADEAGFDMVEIHMAHGYLLASFISPLTNVRQDEFGGPIQRRMRFPLEVFAACRAVWPSHKPMSVRISAADWSPGGLSSVDLLLATGMLQEAGADLIDVSTGQTVPDQEPVYGRMYQTPFADVIRNQIGIATMAVGNITTADQVNTVLLQGRADLVALARPHLTNPYFTAQAAAQYGYLGHEWPDQYLPGRDQAIRLGARQAEEELDLRMRAKPASHVVT